MNDILNDIKNSGVRIIKYSTIRKSNGLCDMLKDIMDKGDVFCMWSKGYKTIAYNDEIDSRTVRDKIAALYNTYLR